MKRRADPNQILFDWTARVHSGEASTRKTEETQSTRFRKPSPPKRRSPARLPVPIPLPEAIEQAHFGKDPDTDEPVSPRPAEVRAITEHHAERMIDLLHDLQAVRASDYRQKDHLDGQYKTKLAMYAEDFGEEAAGRLDSYVRHEAAKENRGR